MEFGVIQGHHQGATVEINGLADKEETAKLAHTTCRGLQQQACDASTQCNKTREEKWRVVEDKEDLMTISYRTINEEWCVPAEVAGEDEDYILTETFYEKNVKIYETYKSRKEAAELAWDDYKNQLPICEALTEAYLTQLAYCISNQTALEKASCTRANRVEHWTTNINNAWTAATLTYTNLTSHTLEMASERQLEWQGVQSVKCLLDRIYDNSNSDTPCNETSDSAVIEGQIASCHTAVNVSHLVIEPEEIPETPVLVLDPYPCTAEYAHFVGYDELQSCTPAETCNGQVAGCSPLLPQPDEPVGTTGYPVPPMPSESYGGYAY